MFEVSQCQIKEIKVLFRVKRGEIKEAFFRFLSSLTSLLLLLHLLVFFSQQNGSSRRGSSLCYHQRDQDKAIQAAVFLLQHPALLLPQEMSPEQWHRGSAFSERQFLHTERKHLPAVKVSALQSTTRASREAKSPPGSSVIRGKMKSSEPPRLNSLQMVFRGQISK